ncbi:MAG: SCO family protein [Thermoflexales bacterium]|nr:SCO family protein [Thermoflexales bacterium]
MSFSKRVLAAAAAVTLSACAGQSTPSAEPTLPPRAIRVQYPITPPDLPLVNHEEQPTRLSDFRGRVVLIAFVNLRCREQPCVQALPIFHAVQRDLGARSTEVAFVLVGVDEREDNPQALKAELAAYSPAFVGVTAPRAVMRELALRFGIHTYENREGVLVPHAPFLYVLDRRGRLIYFLQYGLSPKKVAEVIRAVLDEADSPVSR